jgi:hypothetical protein
VTPTILPSIWSGHANQNAKQIGKERPGEAGKHFSNFDLPQGQKFMVRWVEGVSWPDGIPRGLPTPAYFPFSVPVQSQQVTGLRLVDSGLCDRFSVRMPFWSRRSWKKSPSLKSSRKNGK